MLGIIEEYQIIVVQLQPDPNPNAYVECWGIEFNGRAYNNSYVYIKCFSAYPSIVIGKNNEVNFGKVHQKCEEIVNVAIKNTSVSTVEYVYTFHTIHKQPQQKSEEKKNT